MSLERQPTAPPRAGSKSSGRLLGLLLHFVLKVLYRYEVRGLEHLARLGPQERVLVVVNHVSFLDGPLLMAVLGDCAVFAINTAMAQRWWLKPFRRVANLFSLDPGNPLPVRAIIEQIEAGPPCVIMYLRRCTTRSCRK